MINAYGVPGVASESGATVLDIMSKDRDLRRRESVILLGWLAVGNVAEKDVRSLIAKNHRDSFDKEGKLESDDFTFSFENGVIPDAVPFEYLER